MTTLYKYVYLIINVLMNIVIRDYSKISFTERSQRRIQGCCNIQDGVLCDNSERLKAINYYHKALHLGCCSSPRSVDGSDRIEASKFAGFYSIRVFREKYFRSVHSSKILLLLNYFIFDNLFELAIFLNYCPTLLKFVQEGFFLYFRDAD